MAHSVLDVRVDALEEWRRDHASEDDARYESHERRIQSLELSRAKLIGGIALAAAGGSALMNLALWLLAHLVK